MSGHVTYPTFFNKKYKDWTSKTLVNPPYVRSHLIFTSPPVPSIKLDVICVSSLAGIVRNTQEMKLFLGPVHSY